MPLRKRFVLLPAAALALGAAAVVFANAEPESSLPCLPADREASAGSGAPLPAAVTGNLLVANQFGGTATLVELGTRAVTHLETGVSPHDAAVSPDGRWGVVSNFGPSRDERHLGNRLFVVDMARKRIARVIDTGEHRGLHDVAFRPGFPTRVLVTAQTARKLIEVDVATGAIVGSIDTRADRSHLVAVTRDGRTAFTTNEGTGTVSRLDLAERRFVASFPAWPEVEGIAVTADGKELWVGHNAKGAVKVLDASTGAVRAVLPGFRFPVRMVTAPDGRIVVSDPGCRAVVVADPATRRVISTTHLPYDQPVLAGDVAPDGRVAFVALGGERAVIALDLQTGRVLARHRAGSHPDGLGWGPIPPTGK
jgi:DNA-binding beta-propeller fold protein YncE